MTTPGDENGTRLDPGRVPRSRPPGDNLVGRGPADGGTRADPGRPPRPPLLAAGGQADQEPWGDSKLPPVLAARFKWVKDLTGASAASGQAVTYLVRDRADDRQVVLKLYHAGEQPARQVWDWLRRAASAPPGSGGEHIVKVFETDVARGPDYERAYEVMEYLAGGDLYSLRQSGSPGVDAEVLGQVVGQVAAALAHAHDSGIVQRDVKPANIMVRSQDPLDVALIDFGISSFVPTGRLLSRTQSMTLGYAAPEFLGVGEVTQANDWWGLGMTVAELASGKHPFEGQPDPVIRKFFSSARSIDLSAIADSRLRLLCRGLLLRDEADRWGYAQVSDWCDGVSPVVRDRTGQSAEPEADEVRESFTFRTESFTSPAELAQALAEDWSGACGYLFPRARREREPLRALIKWLAAVEDFEHTAERRRELEKELTGGDPPDVKLHHLLCWLWPGRPSVYRSRSITSGSLPALAMQAIGRPDSGVPSTDEHLGREIVNDLWHYRLLPDLAEGLGGSGLDRLDDSWRWHERRYREIEQYVRQRYPQAHRALTNLPAGTVPCYLLWLASAPNSAQQYLRDAATTMRQRLMVDLPWYSVLTGPTASDHQLFCAVLLAGYAEAEALRLRDQREAERREVEAATSRDVDWRFYQRHARPVALGWAGAGIAVVAGFWVWLIGLSDLLPFASNQDVNLGWACAVLSILAFGAAELGLAAVIGAPYHGRNYSLIHAGLSQLGRAIRPIRNQGLILLALIIFGLAALIAATSYLPYVLPLATTVGELAWVRHRYRRWQADEEDIAIRVVQAGP